MRTTGTTYLPTLQKSDIGSAANLGGKVYTTEASRSFESALTDENVMGLVYSGSNLLHVDHIIVSTNSPYARAELYVNATDISSSINDTPTNLHIGGADADVTASTGEGVPLTGSILPDNKIVNLQLSSGMPTYKYEFNGSLVLTQNETLLLRGQVSSSGDYLQTSFVYTEFIKGD